MTNTPPNDPKIEYQAFISYTGSGNSGSGESSFDRTVAKHLIRLLETYRTPRSLTRERKIAKQIGKVFRDRDELSAASDLKESLLDPLRRSRFLIVVCSPRARASRWVNQEVETFAQMHSEDRILTLLIEGEPGEAFPPGLIRKLPTGDEVLPLGADIRGPSRRESLRRLKNEKLRLLAPMLGCRFDDLRQREHERTKRRMAMTVTGLTFLCAILTTLVLFAVTAERKAERRYGLALDAQETILPLVVDPPADLERKEVYLSNAVDATRILCAEDTDNADCSAQLISLKVALSDAHRLMGRETEAEKDFGEVRHLSLLASLQRLRNWSPGKGKRRDSEIFETPRDDELDHLRSMLEPWDRFTGESARVVDAVSYAEYGSALLELLDTTTPAGKAEARRVLEKNLELFGEARTWKPFTPEQAELRQELVEALGRVGH